MKTQSHKWLRIAALIIMLPMILAMIGALGKLPAAIQAVRERPKADAPQE